jgi:ribosomal-protein-serine acetyltransferase
MDASFPVKDGIVARLLCTDDAGAFVELVRKNFERLAPWFSWTTGGFSEQPVRAYVAEADALWRGGHEYPYGLWDGEALAGYTGLHRIDRHNAIVRIGYWIDGGYEGRGIIRASTRALVDRAFFDLHLNRVEIRCAPQNHASRRVPERLGFTLEGTHREVLAIHGGFKIS